MNRSRRIGHRFIQFLIIPLATALITAVDPAIGAQSEKSFLQAVSVQEHARVTLRAPLEIAAGESEELVFEFALSPGWHIYWVNPGDSGEAPKAEVAGVEAERAQWQAGELVFPTPQRIPVDPFTNFGFDGIPNAGLAGETIVPLRWPVALILPSAPTQAAGKTVLLPVKLGYLICREKCVPETAKFALKLAALPGEAAKTSAALADWRKRLQAKDSLYPVRAGAGSNTEPLKGSFRHGQDGRTLEFSLPQALGAFSFFPRTTPFLRAGDPGVRMDDGGTTGSQFRVEVDETLPQVQWPEQVSGLIVPADTARAPLWAEFARVTEFSWMECLATLGFAALGGLILNLMPCVFPVVSLKVLSFVREAHGESAKIRLHAFVYSAGILVSLWLLAIVLMLLKGAGQSIGWGFQLQEPLFLAALVVIFAALAMNLMGWFEINYAGPASLQNLMMRRGLIGSFFTGLLTTIVATPCSAPFMGVAIGAALGSGPAVSLAIFTALGIGLAAPSLLLALRPSLLRRLPKAGAWMETLKEFLAFPLFLTVLWLAWVLSEVQGAAAGSAALGLCVLLGFFVWARRRQSRAMLALATFALLFGSVFAYRTLTETVSSGPIESSGRENSSVPGATWRPWSEAAVAEARTRGQAVFVDFTAAWCVTCQVNKRAVLATAAASDLFQAKNIALFRADWTRRDAAITQALAKLGRNSVPVYAVYRPGESAPRLLPELLTLAGLQAAYE